MSWTDDLVAGVAQILDAASVGVWDRNGYTSTISIGALEPDVESGIALTPYGLTNQRTSLTGEVTQPVQFWLRGTRAEVDTAADGIYDALNGLRGVTVGGAYCVLIELHSDIPQGVDQSGRYERSVNYDFWATRVTAQTL